MTVIPAQTSLRVLAGGALKGLVQKLESRLAISVHGEFGPVGGKRDQILNGDACDVAILSRELIKELVGKGNYSWEGCNRSSSSKEAVGTLEQSQLEDVK
eukprot:gnl/MRDRNA2_/MRDRNA2_31247_c0_seq2.p3 gnl/MRDRNA2_/MRDRNA2_31247_c0~~gnl/MRDRNA2_/MRDRNA2_31247_c0_seq2.p3  ORF type:complete len:100 (-),score=22.51 gnl/MRDRNA2_/MRDRNA2_31247_c0_seq2:361-660(-)